MSTEKQKVKKKRYWACFVYPDSAPEDWQDILIKTGLSCAISPLHDGDINADESEKKPHWHVIMCWPGPTTYAVAEDITNRLNAPIPQAVENVRGYYRYLTHRDSPDKAQYDEKDIVLLNGFDIADFIELSATETDTILWFLQSLIREKCIHEYASLMAYLQDSDLRTEWSVARKNTVFLDRFISSGRYMAKAKTEQDMAKKVVETARLRDEQDAIG